MFGKSSQKQAKGAQPPGNEPQSERQRMLKAVASSQKIAKAQEYGQALRDKAAQARDPQERERLFKQAYAKEVEANGERSKLASRMQSGTWQGMFGGGGIGLGTGLGLGAVVGTLVGTILSVPTTALGTLIGAGVGAVHGPWITIGGTKKRWQDATPEQVVDHFEKQSSQGGQLDASPAAQGNDGPPAHAERVGPPPPRKKPRKLEIRSQANMNETVTPSDMPATPPRRPRKLDSRSQSRTNALQSQEKENLQELSREAHDSGYAEDG